MTFDERENAAEERDSATADRDEVTEERHSAARRRESVADERESVADERETAADERGSAARRRESVADARDRAADTRDSVADTRDEAAQRRELSYARAVLESAPDAMVIVDADGIIQLANVATETLFGYRRAMLVGRRVDMLLPLRYEDRHPDGRAGFFSASGAGALSEDLDLWGQRQSGSEVAVEIRLNPLESEEGLVVAAIRDVSARRKAEQFRQAVMDNMADGLYVVDGEGCLSYMNAAATRMLGFSEEELLGKPMHDAVHYQHADGSAFPPEECELERVRSEGRTVRKAKDAFMRKDGTILPTAYSAAPLGTDTSGYGVVVVFRDTTDERPQRTAPSASSTP